MVIDGNKTEESSKFSLDMKVFLSKNFNVAIIDCHRKIAKRMRDIVLLNTNFFIPCYS